MFTETLNLEEMMSDLTGVAIVLLIVYSLLAVVIAWLLTEEHHWVFALVMGVLWLPLYILGLIIKIIGGLRGQENS